MSAPLRLLLVCDAVMARAVLRLLAYRRPAWRVDATSHEEVASALPGGARHDLILVETSPYDPVSTTSLETIRELAPHSVLVAYTGADPRLCQWLSRADYCLPASTRPGDFVESLEQALLDHKDAPRAA